MTLTIELTPEQKAQLVTAAKQTGLAPAEFLKQLMAEHLPHSTSPTLQEILAPVHEYSREQGYTEAEIGEFVDDEVAAYRAERRARKTATP